MSATERDRLTEQAYDLTYAAMSKSYGMPRTEIADTILNWVNPELTRIFFSVVSAGLKRYGIA